LADHIEFSGRYEILVDDDEDGAPTERRSRETILLGKLMLVQEILEGILKSLSTGTLSDPISERRLGVGMQVLVSTVTEAEDYLVRTKTTEVPPPDRPKF
jgi:hypothetical protein